MSVKTANVARFLKVTAEDSPECCALKVPLKRDDGGNILYESLTFAELYTQSSAVAFWLQDYGVSKGDRVLVMVRPGLELIQVTFALFMIGAVPIVIDPGMGLRSFLRCVSRSKPKFLVGIPLAICVSRLFFSFFWSLKKRIKITPEVIKGVHLKFKEHFKCVESKSTDLAAILFTSGSTGIPKGVLYEHGMFEAQVELIKRHYDIQPGEVDMPMLPIFALFNPALGMTTIVPEMNPSKPAEADPEKLVQAIHQNKITNSFGSPVLWSRIGIYCNKYNVTLPSLRRILMAGAPVAPKLMWLYKTVAPNATVHSPYGATESLPVASITSHEVLDETWPATDTGRGTCVGRPLPGMEVRIIQIQEESVPEVSQSQALGKGEIGEIIVKGPVVTKGYDALGDATAKAKIREGSAVWHRMGDAGYFDEEGRLWFCGRVAEAVVTPDRSLYTDCVEPLFNNHRCVYRSALIGLGEKGVQRAAVVIQPIPDYWPRGKKRRKEFTEALKKIATENKLNEIERFFFLRNLPVDVRHNAKINRLALGKRFAAKVG